MTFSSSFLESVRDSVEQYGTYAFRIDIVDEKVSDKLQKDRAVDEILYACYFSEEVYEEEDAYYYTYIFDDEERLGLYGYQLIEGEYPQEGEVLIDFDYLVDNGYDSEIIGQKIPFDSQVLGEKQNYTISGIISRKEVFENTSFWEYAFVFYDEDPEYNCTYVTFNRYNNFKNDLERINDEYAVDVYANWGVYFDLGYGDDISLYEQNQRLYHYIYILILICMIFLIYNIIKICIHDQYEKFAILNLLGVNKSKSIAGFGWVIYRYIFLGGLAGGIAAFCTMLLIHKKIYGSLIIYKQVLEQFALRQYLGGVLGFIFILTLFLIPLVIRLWKQSPCALLQERKSVFNLKVRKYHKFVFSSKTGNWQRKLAKHYLKNDIIMRIFTTIGCCLATCIMVIGIYYIKTNYAKSIGNHDYAYCIQLYEFYSESQGISEKKESMDVNLGFGEDIILHSLGYFCNSLDSGDNIQLLFDDEEKRDISLQVKQSVKQLSLYPENGEYWIIIIVSENFFQEIFEVELPMKVYIREKIPESDYQNYDNLEQMKYNKNFSVSYPLQDELNEVKLNRILKIFVYLIFVITLIVANILLISSNYLRLHVNMSEYAMMKAIGIGKQKLCRIFLCEISIIFVEAEIIACIISYFMTKYLYILKYPVTGTFLYHYPWRETIFAVLLSVFIAGLSIIPILRKLNGIDLIKELKSTH